MMIWFPWMILPFLALEAIAAPGMSKKYDTLVVFGDCMSDNGISQRDPYGFRPFTTGKVWADYLAENLGLMEKNYAFGGANSDYGNYYFASWSGLLWQVDKFIEEVNGTIDPKMLIGYEAGGLNDLWRDPSALDPAQIAKNNVDGVKKLLDHGAKDIFLLLLPDVKLIPGVRRRPGIMEPFDRAVTTINGLMKNATEDLELPPNSKLMLIDFGKLFSDLAGKLKLEPFALSKTTAFGDQKEYAFTADAMHLTDSAHYLLSRGILKAVKESLYETQA